MTAKAFIDSVLLEWESFSETDVIGFNLERAPGPIGPWAQLNPALVQAKAIGQANGSLYEYVDPTVEPGARYYYRLVILDRSSTPSYEKPIQVTVPLMGQPYQPYIPPTPSSLHRIFLPLVVW